MSIYIHSNMKVIQKLSTKKCTYLKTLYEIGPLSFLILHVDNIKGSAIRHVYFYYAVYIHSLNKTSYFVVYSGDVKKI